MKTLASSKPRLKTRERALQRLGLAVVAAHVRIGHPEGAVRILRGKPIGVGNDRANVCKPEPLLQFRNFLRLQTNHRPDPTYANKANEIRADTFGTTNATMMNGTERPPLITLPHSKRNVPMLAAHFLMPALATTESLPALASRANHRLPTHINQSGSRLLAPAQC